MIELSALYSLAEEHGISVDCFELQKRGALSIKDIDGDCFIAINPLMLENAADERSKISHELGHCMTGSFYNVKSSFDIRQKHENRADKWAIERILSQEDLDNAVADGCTDIWSLAEHFGISTDLMRKAVCWYTHGNLAAELYF